MIFYDIESGMKQVFKLPTENYITIGSLSEVDKIFDYLEFDKRFIDEIGKSVMPKLESFNEMDYIYVYDIDDNLEKSEEYWIFLEKKRITLFCEDEEKFREKFLGEMEGKNIKFSRVSRVLWGFLNQLMIDDVNLVRKLESDIEDLEERILSSKPKAVNMEIIGMKKKLLFLRHYYEQILEVACDIEENENNLIPEEELKSFKNLTGRLERITKSIIMLRDYLTQVREAHQAEEDLRLNATMEIFTVITAIFFPLTLLTGWYGMNFKNMPELSWRYGYFGVFIAGILIVVSLIYYFKKKNILR
ncbi:MAG: magnesium transporter CorA family protein [Filifactoraceae bacterium]